LVLDPGGAGRAGKVVRGLLDAVSKGSGHMN
jgi:hypothetical protein